MENLDWKKRCPPRVELATTPTPLQPLPRLSEKLGVNILIKRDDLTGTELSGNKVRKLEFVMADALLKNADTVMTCGGAQSNHARATAVAAAKLGLACRLVLRTPDPTNPPPIEANILLDRMAGAEIVWITPDEYRRRNEVFDREAEILRKAGHQPYVIPEGASNALGTWGYIRAAEELKQDIDRLGLGPSAPITIVHAVGSGGTISGLILGACLHELNARIVGVNVCDDRDYFVRAIGDICEKAISTYAFKIPFQRHRDIEILDGYVGLGYALSRAEELEGICELARLEGIFLDPVYTGKAFYGMSEELRKNPKAFGECIIFLHTGGIFDLFAITSQLVPLL